MTVNQLIESLSALTPEQREMPAMQQNRGYWSISEVFETDSDDVSLPVYDGIQLHKGPFILLE